MKHEHQKGFAPLVIILLVVLGLGVAGGGYVLYKDKQEQKKLETQIQDLQNQPVNDVSNKPSTNTTTTSTKLKFSSVSSLPVSLIYPATTKDANNVYFENKIIPNADPATFQAIGGMYLKDKNNVFTYSCFGEGSPYCVSILKNADVKTFTALSNFLAKDFSHVFYYEEIIQNADPNTLVIASYQPGPKLNSDLIFLKDKKYVYYVQARTRAEVLPNADPATFEPLSWYYSKDAKNVYFFTDIVLNADPATFELLKEIYYGKDNKNVYFHEKIIQGADPKTFISLGGSYFKDSTSVYKEGVKIPNTDPQTFKVLTGSDKYSNFTINNNIVYYTGLKIPDADATSFVAIGEFYGKDKNFAYFKTRKVPGADVATFRANAYVALDKNHFYEFDKVLNSPSESQYGGWEDLGVQVPR